MTERKCNKSAYSSKSDAVKDAKYIKASQRGQKHLHQAKNERKLTPYPCVHCGFWHLTSMKQKHYQKKRKSYIRKKIKEANSQDMHDNEI